MEEKGVIDVYCRLKNADIKIWIDGGWGVDALLGKQTRIHQDLDIVIQQKDLSAFRNLLADQGYDEIKTGIARPHNFVLSDDHHQEIDVHVIVFNSKGDGIYGPAQQGGLYPAASLTGKGKIAGLEVHCISPEYVVRFHSGYGMKEKDRMDVLAICKAFIWRFQIICPVVTSPNAKNFLLISAHDGDGLSAYRIWNPGEFLYIGRQSEAGTAYLLPLVQAAGCIWTANAVRLPAIL